MSFPSRKRDEVYEVHAKYPVDEQVTQAISEWVHAFQWPYWFAKNVVLWRKERKLPWTVVR